MIVAASFLLLAQPLATCPAGSGRLGGDALIVKPIGTYEPAPFILLGPTTDIREDSGEIRQTGAADEAPPEPNEALPDTCEPPISNT